MIKRRLKQLSWHLTLVGILALGMGIGGSTIYFLSPTVPSAQAQTDEDESDAGVLISKVMADSPAAEAGLVRGDILLAIDNQEVSTVSELLNYLLGKAAGDDVTLSVLHGDDERTLTATLSDQQDRPYLGIVPCSDGHHVRFGMSRGPGFFFKDDDGGKFEGFLEQLPDKFHLEEGLSQGVIVRGFSEDSPAEAAGLARGDIITALDDTPIDSVEALVEALTDYAPDNTVTLTVQHRDDETEREVEITLSAHPDDADVAFLGIQLGQFMRFHQEKRLPDEQHRGFQKTWPNPDSGLLDLIPMADIEAHIFGEGGIIKMAKVGTAGFSIDALPLEDHDFHFFSEEDIPEFVFGDGSL